MWHGVTVVDKPTGELIPLPKLKQRLRIDVPDDDDLLPDYLAGSIARVDGPNGIGFAMLTQTWRKTMDCFPRCILLPGAPIKAVVSVSYIDSDGNEQTMDASDYRVDPGSEPVRIEPAFDKSWPTPRDVIGAVKVDYKLGVDDPADVPPDLIDAICLLVGHRYENREAVNVGNIVNEYPLGVEYILREYRRAHVAA